MKKTIFPIAVLLALVLTTSTIAQPMSDPTWVVMHGRVETYGAGGAFGWCGVYAEIGEWAQAFIGWIPWGGPQIPVIFSFYAARLNETSVVELDYGGADLYIEGSWDVYNVTFIYEPGETPGNYTLIIELLVDDGRGTLSVTGNWENFTVDIVDSIRIELTGTVTFWAKRPLEPIPIGDCSGVADPGVPDHRVDIWDLVHVAKAYGSIPDPSNPAAFFSVDFNWLLGRGLDFEVGMCELTTVAASLGEEY